MGNREIRIKLNCLFQETQSLKSWLLRVPVFDFSRNNLFFCLKIHIVCLQILGRFCFDALLFFWRECSRKFARYSLSNLALNCKDLCEMPVVTVRPDGIVNRRVL